jgi:hypothetical protein
METFPTRDLLGTLKSIKQVQERGWGEINGFDANGCLKAGWIVAHDKGYRLTGTGEEVLRRYSR